MPKIDMIGLRESGDRRIEMIRVLCNGKCHIDPECLCHAQLPLTMSAYPEPKKAQKCPVCDGAGALPNIMSNGQPIAKCHGCDSKGWVAV